MEYSMIRFDHIMIHTTNTDESIKFYEKVFEMELDNVDHYDHFDLAYMRDASTNVKFELRNNYDLGQQPIGNVVGHFAFYVDDVDKIEKRIIEFYPHLFHKMEVHVSKEHGKTYRIFSVKSPEGIELSALQKIIG